MNIDELLTAIDTWRAADAHYKTAHLAWNECDTDETWKTRASAVATLHIAAAWFTDNPFTKTQRETLAMVTTLADEIRRLRATLEHVDKQVENLQHVIEDSIKDQHSSHASLFLLRDIRNMLKGDE